MFPLVRLFGKIRPAICLSNLPCTCSLKFPLMFEYFYHMSDFILQYLSWTNFYPCHPCISLKFDLLKASGEPEKLLNHHRSNKSVDMFCRMSYEAEVPHWCSFTCPPQWCHRLLCEGLMLAAAINQ